MPTRTAASLCALSLSLIFGGCYTTVELSRDQIVPGEEYDILEVTTTSGEHYVLRQLSGGDRGIIRDSTVVGVPDEGRVVEVPLSQVRSIQVSRYNPGNTSIFILIAVPVGLLALAGAGMALFGGLGG
jgi:hypothetical protein